MSNLTRLSMKRAVMLGISNKTLPALVDRMTIYISSSENAKAKQELKEIKIQIAEIERLLMESEKLERENANG